MEGSPEISSEMLPFCPLPSISEKVGAHRKREERFCQEDALEAEKSAEFGLPSRHRHVSDFGDLLLGTEFQGELDADEKAGGRVAASRLEFQRGVNVRFEVENSELPRGSETEERDWTVGPLSPTILSMLDGIESVTISVPTTRGGQHPVTLCSRTLDRIRGAKKETESNRGGPSVLSWLDDNTIDGFMSLINRRSQDLCCTASRSHRPSKNRDMFNRLRVRAFVLSSQFYTIWKRVQNGGYENVRRWRRKIPDYNSVGMYMFPAFVNHNHWVLAVVDIDGQQLIYYDPQMRNDVWDVMRCAKEWISGEVRAARRGDTFKGLKISSWPTVLNPWRMPAQMDSQSCGVFVSFVAEHLERGAIPRFTQSDIPIMRLRMLFILQQGKLLADADPLADEESSTA